MSDSAWSTLWWELGTGSENESESAKETERVQVRLQAAGPMQAGDPVYLTPEQEQERQQHEAHVHRDICSRHWHVEQLQLERGGAVVCMFLEPSYKHEWSVCLSHTDHTLHPS